MTFQSETSLDDKASTPSQSLTKTPIDIPGLGWALSSFFVTTYILCIAFGIIIPDWEMHRPWLQFFPGFEWLTFQGFVIGLVEAFIYGWYVAVVLGSLYNFFNCRSQSVSMQCR